MRAVRRAAALALALATGPAGGARAAEDPFPVDLRLRFELIDPTGATRTERDFGGRHLLVFFGFLGCDSICGVALPTLAAALDALGPEADAVAPLLITIDPERDTAETLGRAAPAIHPRLVGLTGSEAALAAARASLGVEATTLFTAPDGAPVMAHGAFLYLADPEGRVLSVLPPVLAPERIAEIVSTRLAEAADGLDAAPARD